MVESLFTTVWQTPDRVLHEVRRFAARAAASHRGRRPGSILLVCHGDVCRSPFATVILGRWLASARISVTSAGFVGPSRKSPPEAIHAAHRRDVNLTAHRSRVLDSTLVGNADLVGTHAAGALSQDRAGRVVGDHVARRTEPAGAAHDRSGGIADIAVGARGDGAARF